MGGMREARNSPAGGSAAAVPVTLASFEVAETGQQRDEEERREGRREELASHPPSLMLAPFACKMATRDMASKPARWENPGT
jgi:hypothetical protein